MKLFAKIGLAITVSVAAVATSAANSWPEKPVLIIGGGAPGGPVEMTIRGFSEALSENLGKPFAIESKPGAGGHIANEFVARAVPDGYTFGMTSIAPHGIGPSLYQNLNYDPAEFTFVSRLVGFPNVIYVPKDSPYNTLGELLAAAKEQPGMITQGSIGIGSSTQMIGVMLMQEAGVELNHVAFKGSAPLVTAIMSGEIDMAVDNLPGVLGQVQAGAVKALAVSSKARANQLPDVPTVEEAGFPGFDISSWYGLIGPKGVPAEIAEKLSAEVETVLNSDGAKEYYENMGAQLIYLPGSEFEAFVASEMEKWAPVVKASGAKVE